MKNLLKIVFLLVISSVLNFNTATSQTWTQYVSIFQSSIVTTIAFDNQNIKWIGTNDAGIFKFNDTTFTHYTMADGLTGDCIYDIEIDENGNKWIGTNDGVSVYNDTGWISYTTANGLPGNNVNAIEIDMEGTIWFGTNGGVTTFDGLNWENINIGLVTCIAVDRMNNKWFGTFDSGVIKFDNTNFTKYSNPDVLGANKIIDICADVQNNIWIIGENGPTDSICISKFNGLYWTILYENYNIGLGSPNNSIAIDALNKVWVTTFFGCFVLDGSNQTFICTPGDCTDNSIGIDYQGNKWIGTHMDGLCRYSDGGAGPLGFTSIIQGSIFYDSNENGILDSSETKLQGEMVEVLNDSTFATTQNNGNFYIARDSGSYQLKCIADNYWQFTTDSIITVHVSDTSINIDNINFGIHLQEPISDVLVDIAGNTARANFNVNYWLTYKNEASVTKSGTVVLNIDPLTTFVSSVPPPDAQNGNTVTWNYSNLVPFEQRQIQLFLHMPDVSHLGETIYTTAIVNPVPGDIAPTNNYDTLDQVITGSYDPNDKSVNKGTMDQGYTLMGEELSYTVRFQNTGTDTAFTVQIRDTISSNMDVASLRIVSSSHHVRLDVKGKNTVTFIFDNILLPDSSTNEAASSGFVKFSVMPKPGLPEYTVVKNKAYIYFDFNPAIVTNQVVNTYVGNPNSDIEDITTGNQLFCLFPNPATNILTVDAKYPSQIKIYNMMGILLKNMINVQIPANIDVSGLPPGLYLIEVKSEKQNAVRKFIKE